MEHEEIFNELQPFVEGHPLKNHLYNYAHEHLMEFCDEKETDVEVCCAGCSSPIEGAMYACTKCQCYFHKPCAELPRQIRHVSHKLHPLTLIQDPLTLPTSMCSGCNLPLSGTTYGCIDCCLFLHKSCLELPPELKHRLHPFHRLFLDSESLDDSTHFKCRSCFESNNGFNYYCDKCHFYLGIGCCMLSKATGCDRTKGHILSLLSKRSVFHSANDDCLACGEELGTQDFFRCSQCKFVLHIPCVLPPTLRSVHHRHTLELSYAEEEDENSDDEWYCINCETRRYPAYQVPFYRCPVKECNFVAHSCCEFREGNISYAHRLDSLLLDASTLMIKNPALNVRDITWQYTLELQNLYSRRETAVDAKIWIGKDLFEVEENNCESGTIKDLSVGCDKAFAEFMKSYESRDIKEISDMIRPYRVSIVEKVGEYYIPKMLAPVLKALFARYGDFSARSALSPMVKTEVLSALCEDMYIMCHKITKYADQITDQSLLFFWWDNLKLAWVAGFKIQFAVDCFKKALHTCFGLIYTDQAMDELARDITMLRQEFEAFKFEYTSDLHRISQVVTNSRTGKCSGETIELQNVFMANNSWSYYFLETGEAPETDRQDAFDDNLRREGYLSYYEPGDVKHLSLWDYQSIINNIKTFFEHHPITSNDERTNGNKFCWYSCKLDIMERPFYECTICDVIFQHNTRGLPQKFCLHGHPNPTLLQEPPVDMRQARIQYERETFIIERCTCIVCALPLWGSTYNCKKHNISYHKDCVPFPLEIKHRLHPMHPLLLQWDLRYNRDGLCFSNTTVPLPYLCHGCGGDCRGSVFSCQRCDFYLEVRCIFREPTIKTQYHKHLLTLIEEQSELLHLRRCSICLMEIKCFPILYCGLCNFTSHVQCALPSTIKCSGHLHPLTMADSYKEDYSDEFYCTACEQRRKSEDPVYCCLKCNVYVAHIRCAMATKERDVADEDLAKKLACALLTTQTLPAAEEENDEEDKPDEDEVEDEDEEDEVESEEREVVEDEDRTRMMKMRTRKR